MKDDNIIYMCDKRLGVQFLIDREKIDKALGYDPDRFAKGYEAGLKDGLKICENSGKIAINKRTGKKCVIIREWDTGQILVCESVNPTVFCTHDSWKTLELVEEEE